MTAIQSVSAQGPPPARQIEVARPVTARPLTLQPVDQGEGAFRGLRDRAATVTIHGVVQNHVGMLVPNAGLIVIRRLDDGADVGRARVDALAQFTLRGFEPGTYAAELVDSAGRVIATSGAFTAGPGQVIRLAPVIPDQALTGLWSVLGNATDGVLSSAATAGVMAISTGLDVSDR